VTELGTESVSVHMRGRSDRACNEVHLRILFAAEPGLETAIRQRIESALSTGLLQGPDGVTTRWQVRSSWHSDVDTEDMDQAERLIRY
jgi:hypothetical protein